MKLHAKNASYTWVIPTNRQHALFKKTFCTKKEGKYNAYRKLIQIIDVFNYTQLALIFSPLIQFTKRFEGVNKSDECFYENLILTPSESSSH